jgi:YfiH family protein
VSRLEFIRPEWPAPSTVHAAFTLRGGGVSAGPFESLNLGTHVGDDPAAVAENRSRIQTALSLPNEPVWLEQVHGIEVLDLDAAEPGPPLRADAVVTRTPGRVCAIQIADCMPVLFSSLDGQVIGAAHAGWRGLAGGVLEATILAMRVQPPQLIAWLGPAIGPLHFEVGDEVREAFSSQDNQAAAAFTQNSRGRWQCDLYALARLRLTKAGTGTITGGQHCTYSDPTHFFSYRRDTRCGRMAALIWLPR